jgi:hypothetical protein
VYALREQQNEGHLVSQMVDARPFANERSEMLFKHGDEVIKDETMDENHFQCFLFISETNE